jgi:hypothetical protein
MRFTKSFIMRFTKSFIMRFTKSFIMRFTKPDKNYVFDIKGYKMANINIE